MADTKKTAKKAPAKKAIEVKSIADLEKELLSARADLMQALRGHRAGELTNPRVLGSTRKQIARLMTQINAKQEKK